MPQSSRPELSTREQQLLELAAEGLTDAGIAHRLGISEATVSTYWGRVRIKLGPHSRTELVAIAIREKNEHEMQALKESYKAQLQQALGQDVQSNLYQELLKSAPDAILLVESDGRIDFMNDEACRMFGYSPDEIVGEDLTKLIPARYRVIHRQHRENYVRNPERRQMGEHQSTLAIAKDGTEFSISASLSATQTPTGTLVTCIIRSDK